MLENRLLRKIFESKVEKEIGDMRTVRSEVLHNLHSSLLVIREIKPKEWESRGMRDVWGEQKCIQNFGR